MRSRCSPSAVIVVWSLWAGTTAFALTYLEYGDQCLNWRDYKKAEVYFKAEIAVNNRSAAAHLGLSKALFFQKRYAETTRELQLVMTLDKNGTLGDQASHALIKLHRLMGSQSSGHAAPRLDDKTPTELLSYRVRLADGRFFSPYSSPRLSADWIRMLKAIETDRDQKLDNSRENWAKFKQEQIGIRDSLEAGSPEWRRVQQFIDDIPRSILADATEIDEDFVRKNREANTRIEESYKSEALRKTAASAVKTPAAPNATKTSARRTDGHDQISSEIEQRLKQLQADMDARVATINDRINGDKAKMELARQHAIAASPADEYSIQEDFSAKWNDLDLRARGEVLAIRQKYAQMMQELSNSATALKSQHMGKRDDDVRFMPAGVTNAYARNYETYGDASGNPIPFTADPKLLRLDSLKPSTKNP